MSILLYDADLVEWFKMGDGENAIKSVYVTWFMDDPLYLGGMYCVAIDDMEGQ